jgi:hypothetical protein
VVEPKPSTVTPASSNQQLAVAEEACHAAAACLPACSLGGWGRQVRGCSEDSLQIKIVEQLPFHYLLSETSKKRKHLVGNLQLQVVVVAKVAARSD